MKPTDEQLVSIAKVLADWNPLGNASSGVPDLNGYQTEAEDIAFGLELAGHKTNIARMTRDVLNEAFDLDLSIDDCLGTAEKIKNILD